MVLPVVFEKAGPVFFNSLAMIDADGELLGLYRKSHIPDGPGYQESSTSHLGIQVFSTMTRYGCVGLVFVGISGFQKLRVHGAQRS